MTERIEVQRTIPAPAADIFAILCDPQGHVAIDATGMLQSADGDSAKTVGDSFVVHMDREALNDYPLGKYDVTVTIREFDQDRLIAWTIVGQIRPQIGHIYGYRLEPADGGTLVAAITSLAMAFMIVLGPLILETARRHIPFFVESNERFLFYARYGVTVTALIVALFILHAWLPAGRRGFLQILPGIIFTMVGSLISGIVFGQYLARFANNYVTMYAGLASVIIALVFLYAIAAIFVYGGELNAAIIKSRLPKGVSLQAAQSLKPAETRA